MTREGGDVWIEAPAVEPLGWYFELNLQRLYCRRNCEQGSRTKAVEVSIPKPPNHLTSLNQHINTQLSRKG